VKVDVVAREDDVLGETPAWDAQSGHLFWVDLRRQRVQRLDLASGEVAHWPMPDGRTIYFADTAVGRIDCAACDPDTGVVGPWRAFADAGIGPGKPDGTAVDAEGCLWNARYGGGCVVRIAPDGRLDRVISLPVSQPTSCTFGGADLATLFITTATQRLSEAQRQSEPLAGALLAVDVGVAGLPEQAFAG
jgi:sugar lactone lactonase YvrE